MRGWQIFTHSAGLVFRNFEAALRLSWLPYLAHVAAQLYLLMNPALAQGPMAAAPGDYALLLALQIAAALGSLWVAVVWHRYVLLEESPEGAVPPFHGGLILGYFGRSLLITLLLVVAFLILAIPAGLLMGALPGALLPMLFVVAAGVLYVFLRLGVILPAGTVGRRVTLHQAWAATAREGGAIATLALLSVLAVGLLTLPDLIAGGGVSLVSTLYGLAVGWVSTMVGVSLLTSLYGICVEGRSIG
jgi:hypothetical protein